MGRYEPLPEPPVGALIKFISGRVYTFLAVRQPTGLWETTASDFGYGLREVMTWAQLTRKFKKFDYATELARVGPDDPRIRVEGAVVWYSVNGHRIAALNISRDGSWLGHWYTTDDASTMNWNEVLVAAGGDIHLVTSWTHYKARLIPTT